MAPFRTNDGRKNIGCLLSYCSWAWSCPRIALVLMEGNKNQLISPLSVLDYPLYFLSWILCTIVYSSTPSNRDVTCGPFLASREYPLTRLNIKVKLTTKKHIWDGRGTSQNCCDQPPQHKYASDLGGNATCIFVSSINQYGMPLRALE